MPAGSEAPTGLPGLCVYYQQGRIDVTLSHPASCQLLPGKPFSSCQACPNPSFELNFFSCFSEARAEYREEMLTSWEALLGRRSSLYACAAQVPRVTAGLGLGSAESTGLSRESCCGLHLLSNWSPPTFLLEGCLAGGNPTEETPREGPASQRLHHVTLNISDR